MAGAAIAFAPLEVGLFPQRQGQALIELVNFHSVSTAC